MPDDPHIVQVVDAAGAKETYVNRIVGSSFDGSTVSITLGCARVVPEQLGRMPTSSPTIYVVDRLCLTPAAAADLAKVLNATLDTISKGIAKPN